MLLACTRFDCLPRYVLYWLCLLCCIRKIGDEIPLQTKRSLITGSVSIPKEYLFKFTCRRSDTKIWCNICWKTTALQTGRSRVRFAMVSLEFFIDIILPAALWLWDRLSLEENECQELFLAGKNGRCVGLTTLTPSCAECHEICEPKPPGTLRACPGLHTKSFTFTY